MPRSYNPNAKCHTQMYKDWLYIKHLKKICGIDYDPIWNSYDTFLNDMGLCPSGMRLTRKNFNTGFSRDNCFWISKDKWRIYKASKTNGSGYIGVVFVKERNRYSVQIEGEKIARYMTADEAAKRYNFEITKRGLNKPLNKVED